jgi:glycosyltransferase involved in cell wall biosynthesis
MHIVLGTPGWPREKSSSGIVTYVDNLRLDLMAKGHKVSILVLGGSDVDLGPDVIWPTWTIGFKVQAKVMRFFGRPGWAHENWGVMIAAALNKLHRRSPIDVFEVEESFGWCGKIKQHISFPMVVKLHGPTFLVSPLNDHSDDAHRKRIAREGMSLRMQNCITSPSKCTLDDTLRNYSLHPKYSAHIVNSLSEPQDLPLWSASNHDRNQLLFVGRFDRVKGADIVLKAFALLTKAKPQLRLIFVGPDSGLVDDDGVKWSALDYAQHLFNPSDLKKISFLGKQPPSAIEKLRAQSALVIIASRWENQSYTTLEAMLQGCPVVASASGGTAELISDGQSGRLFQNKNPESLAYAISDVLDNVQLAATLGANARRYVQEIHAPALVAEATLVAYSNAIVMHKSNSAA